ncbi:MAG: hypothetical protein V1734_02740 [Nanoarchaeota archaeon]
MRKLILFSLIAAVLALMPFAFAANAYELEEFSKENPMQAIILESGDIVDFNLMEGTHRLRLKEIAQSEESIKLNVYPFSNEASMAQAIPFFGLENVVKVDLNQDGTDDVLLDIYEIKEGRVTLIVASAQYIEEINAENALPEITGAPETQGVVKEQKDYTKTYWAIAIAVVLLGVLLYARAIKAKGKKAKHNEEKAEKPHKKHKEE